MNKVVTLVLLVCLSYSQGITQGKKYSLEQSIRLAQSSGPNALMARNSFRSRTFSYRSFNSGLLPRLMLNGIIPDYQRAINPILQNDGTTQFLVQSQAYSTASLTLSQPLVFSGGSVFVSSGLSRTDLFGAINSTYWRSSPLVVGITQPLFQLNTVWWDNKLNDLYYSQAEKKFNEDMEEASIDVTQKFFDVYVASMRVGNAELNVAINDTLLTVSRGRYEVGKIDENDLLQSELALANAKTAFSNAQLDHKIALRTLAIALGISDEELDGIVPPEELATISVRTETAINQAHQNRSDLVNYELQKTNAERELRSQELSNGFNANITASFGYNQTATVLRDVYQNPLEQQAARLDFSMPLFQWGKGSSAIAAAKEDLERTETSIKLQEKSFDQEVEAAADRFLRNQQQLHLSSTADTIAQKQYLLATNRYLIGKYDVTKLLLSQDAKDKARETLILTERDYWLSYYRLRRLTLYDFVSGSPIRYSVDL
jgi:outer membrane protein